jgi:hypothetical protein
MTGFAEYHRYDGLGLAELVRTKQVTAAELVEEAIGRVETRNPAVNAVVYKMYEAARAVARARLPDGPFAGVPFLLKDLFTAYAGVSLSNGAAACRQFVPTYDSELVRRYKRAGGPSENQHARVGPRRSPSPRSSVSRGIHGISAGLPADRAGGPPLRWPRGWCRSPAVATAAARFAFPRPAAASSDSSRHVVERRPDPITVKYGAASSSST